MKEEFVWQLFIRITKHYPFLFTLVVLYGVIILHLYYCTYYYYGDKIQITTIYNYTGFTMTPDKNHYSKIAW